MARNVLAVLIGITVAGLATFFVQSINNGLFPLPQGVEANPEAMKEYVSTLPFAAFIIVIIAHIIGACIGAMVCAIIADSHEKKLALGIGVFMLIMGVANLLSLPHPIWFNIVDVMVYMPAAYLGYRLYYRYWSQSKSQP